MGFLTPTDNLQRIMVARTDGLGDVIVTLPMAVALKNALPNSEVAFLVHRSIAPLLSRITEIDRVFPVSPTGRARQVLKKYKPNAIIFAKPEFKLALDALLSRIDVRIGTGYRSYSGLFTRWIYEHRRSGSKHEAVYGINLLGPMFDTNIPVVMPKLKLSPSGKEEALKIWNGAGSAPPYFVIHPGSKGSASSYPPESFSLVGKELLQQHSDIILLVTGGQGEDELVHTVVQGIGDANRARPVTGLSLDGFSELLRGAQGFLGNSSGPAHLAALVETPVVGLYPGLPPMWPTRWHPIGPKVITLTPGHPENEPLHGGTDIPYENNVANIAPETVLEACHTILTDTHGIYETP